MKIVLTKEEVQKAIEAYIELNFPSAPYEVEGGVKQQPKLIDKDKEDKNPFDDDNHDKLPLGARED